MSKISLAFRCFFALLFGGKLTPELIEELGIKPKTAPSPVVPAVRTSDGALQMLSILQRDARLLDFFLEDIAPYSDEQVGAAARSMHGPAKETIERYVKLAPVVDGVEGTYVKAPSKDAAQVKFLGNVPAAPPEGGTLRHRGWRAASVALPPVNPRQDLTILAPAEIEVE
jgi:Domain of unknown function (DUF2760)